MRSPGPTGPRRPGRVQRHRGRNTCYGVLYSVHYAKDRQAFLPAFHARLRQTQPKEAQGTEHREAQGTHDIFHLELSGARKQSQSTCTKGGLRTF